MKYIKTFESHNSFDREQVKEWLESTYTEDRVITMLDDEIHSGNWIDREQMEDEGYEDEYEYYKDYNNKEAEDAIVDVIVDEYKKSHTLSGDDLLEFIDVVKEVFDCLS